MELRSVESGDKAKASMVWTKENRKSAKKANELLQTVAKSCSSLSNENNEVKPWKANETNGLAFYDNNCMLVELKSGRQSHKNHYKI